MKPPSHENKESISGAMDGYVAAHASGSPASIAELQKLLVTLLAATVADGRVQRLSESRAQELADLLIKAVREANRISESKEDSSD